MGDFGEPGAPSRKIIRRNLATGMGTAYCRCKKGGSDDHAPEHDDDCPITRARARLRELAKHDPILP